MSGADLQVSAGFFLSAAGAASAMAQVFSASKLETGNSGFAHSSDDNPRQTVVIGFGLNDDRNAVLWKALTFEFLNMFPNPACLIFCEFSFHGHSS
jgi:hypothetical protein